MKSFSSLRMLVAAAVVIVAALLVVPFVTSMPAAQTNPAQTQPVPESRPMLAATTQPSTQAHTDATPAGLIVVHQANFGAWRYIAVKGADNAGMSSTGVRIGPDDTSATVTFDENSLNGSRSYVDANRKLLSKVTAYGGQTDVSVVFRTYMPVADFRNFYQKYGMKPDQTRIRIIDEDPHTSKTPTNEVYQPYYTMSIGPTPGTADPLSETEIERNFLQLKTRFPLISLKGVFYTHALVDAKQLPAIAADPQVLFVDVTPAIVRNDLAIAGVQGADKVVVETHAYSVFWQIEHNGFDTIQ